jgi:broad specificity phosphatase PhoE
MSELILIRHGQAAFLSDDYDRLSEHGIEQSRQLGRYWAARNISFDAVYTGPLRRQVGTAALVAEEMRRAGRAWPDTVVLDEFDEYDGDGVLRVFVPLLAEKDERFARLAREHKEAVEALDRRRTFQRLFEAVTTGWVRGELESPGVESWAAFSARVERGLKRAMEGEGKGRKIAVFTSGGPISVVTQRAVRAPTEMAIELNWRILNISLTGIIFSGDRLALDFFNALPHIDDLKFRTYR